MSTTTQINAIQSIAAANPTRSVSNIDRRSLKLAEECGEVAQAVIAVTSADNKKGKTWADVREECADVVIVATDIALSEMPDQTGMTQDERIDAFIAEIERKLRRWGEKRTKLSDNSDVT